ncbi:hypothetical protein [Mycobacterium sp. UM_CSW]|uniref:hypothetical protein n=1 Tax=Mycobacterium sp. UM_CSW TaxID=1370119 RepID=UPI001377F90F|nr:hypothetical protein [Mycobacterium sp. UM_CSW]
MSWLDFIVQMSQAWAWPTVTAGALVFLRKPIKLAATGIVARVGDIRRLKGPGFDLEFEREAKQLAEATEERKALPSTTTGEGSPLPPESTDEKFAKYQELVALDPAAAVLASFADLESLMRQEFERYFPDHGRFTPFRQMLKLFASEGFILGPLVGMLAELGDLRNRVAHEGTRIDANSADYYVRAVLNAIDGLRSQNFFQEPSAPSPVPGIKPIEPPPSSPPLQPDERT